MSQLPAPPATRMLGKSGIEVTSLAWGMWRFAGGAAEATALVHAVLDAGITFFDTADIYGFNGKSGFGDMLRSAAITRPSSASASPKPLLPLKP